MGSSYRDSVRESLSFCGDLLSLASRKTQFIVFLDWYFSFGN